MPKNIQSGNTLREQHREVVTWQDIEFLYIIHIQLQVTTYQAPVSLTANQRKILGAYLHPWITYPEFTCCRYENSPFFDKANGHN